MRRLSLALVSASLILTGCTSAAPDAGAASAWVTLTGACGDAPALEVTTTAAPPTELVVSDPCPGDGPAVAPNASVTAHYVGISLSTAAVFDSSWDRGEPATFPLSGVIAGWQQGLPGMSVGGRRILVIPANLAYGDTPPPGSGIAPGETLVFVVDMVGTS